MFSIFLDGKLEVTMKQMAGNTMLELVLPMMKRETSKLVLDAFVYDL